MASNGADDRSPLRSKDFGPQRHSIDTQKERRANPSVEQQTSHAGACGPTKLGVREIKRVDTQPDEP